VFDPGGLRTFDDLDGFLGGGDACSNIEAFDL
jgi:hypothetical protein